MRKLALAALSTAFVAGTANAALPPSITYTSGVYDIPSYTSAGIFEGFESGTDGTQYVAPAGSGESVTGTVRTLQGNVPGQGFNPDTGSDKYLSIENGSFSVAFSAGQQFFSFVFGSLDSYNSLTLNFSDTTSQTFTGLGIIDGSAANTTPGSGNVNYAETGRVSYNANGGPSIVSATFSSPLQSFEIDSLAAATPEPGTWMMMILGFGLVGGALRVRQRKATIAFA